MVIPVYVKHIATVLLWALCEFLSARQINDKSPVPEDEFLPRKRRKLSFIFFSSPKTNLFDGEHIGCIDSFSFVSV